MNIKLTTKQKTRLATLSASLREAFDNVESAIADYNSAVSDCSEFATLIVDDLPDEDDANHPARYRSRWPPHRSYWEAATETAEIDSPEEDDALNWEALAKSVEDSTK